MSFERDLGLTDRARFLPFQIVRKALGMVKMPANQLFYAAILRIFAEANRANIVRAFFNFDSVFENGHVFNLGI